MCLLTYFPPGIMPNTGELYTGSVFNDDGHGWAVVTDVGILSGRSMSADQAIENFAAVRRTYPENAALFHSRITTHGQTNIDNCHPFRVNGRADMILAHNGILPGDSQPEIGDPRSDTRILAENLMMRRWSHLDSRRNKRRFQKWLGSGSKVLILSVNPSYRSQAYLFNERLGEWTGEGIWYSNTSYQSPRYVSAPLYSYRGSHSTAPLWTPSTRKNWWEDSVESTDLGYPQSSGRDYSARELSDMEEYESYLRSKFECRKCGSVGKADAFLEECSVCGACVCITDSFDECECYLPSQVSQYRQAVADREAML